MWLRKQPIPHGPPESLRLFMLCEAMNWGALPVAGGLYDQHPRLMEEWEYIFIRRSEHDRQVEAAKKRQDKQGRGRAARP